MSSELHDRAGSEVATDQPPLLVEKPNMEPNNFLMPIKKKGGSSGLLPARRRLVKTMVFLSIVQFLSSIFCANGASEPGSARSTPPEIPHANISKKIFPKPIQDD
ncbi:hypothetical protein ACLB2K_010264 [Fragaria x ananassa]